MCFWVLPSLLTWVHLPRNLERELLKDGLISLVLKVLQYKIIFHSIKYLETPLRSKNGILTGFQATLFQFKMQLSLKNLQNNQFASTHNINQVNGLKLKKLKTSKYSTLETIISSKILSSQLSLAREFWLKILERKLT